MSALWPIAVWFGVALIVYAGLSFLNRDRLHDLRNGPGVGIFVVSYLWPVALACLVIAAPFVLIGALIEKLPTDGGSNG